MKKSDSTTLYVITARGGSKGIPRKNIKPFAGRPLIAYSIDVARALAPDDHIIFSTEDEEIAEVARQCGLPVEYMRPAELAHDTTGSREVIIHAMDYADAKGIKYDKVCLLQPTSPLRTIEDVEACLEAYTPDLDMVATVIEARSNPYYNCYEIDEETGCMRICKGDGHYTRRQDAPKALEFNGAVYVFNPDAIRRLPFGQMKRRKPCEMDAGRSLDLDTPLDWQMAEALMKLSNK